MSHVFFLLFDINLQYFSWFLNLKIFIKLLIFMIMQLCEVKTLSVFTQFIYAVFSETIVVNVAILLTNLAFHQYHHVGLSIEHWLIILFIWKTRVIFNCLPMIELHQHHILVYVCEEFQCFIAKQLDMRTVEVMNTL